MDVENTVVDDIHTVKPSKLWRDRLRKGVMPLVTNIPPHGADNCLKELDRLLDGKGGPLPVLCISRVVELYT